MKHTLNLHSQLADREYTLQHIFHRLVSGILHAILGISLLVALLAFAPSSFADCQTQSDVPSAECLALTELYQNNSGVSWKDNANWLNDTPCQWAGISCGSGRVTAIYLAGQGLEGNLTTDLGVFESLVRLNLDFNNLDGPLPDISGISTLEGADFVYNRFSGEIPPFKNLPALRYLNLGGNSFSGSLPTSFASLESLETLILNDNGGDLFIRLGGEFLNLNLRALAFDSGKLCAADLLVGSWLDNLPEAVTEYVFCWSLSADIGDALLGTSDMLFLAARIRAQNLLESVSADLYLSLSLPDGQSEAFFKLGANGIEVEMASSNSADWIPLAENFSVSPGLDTGIAPIFTYPMSGLEPAGNYVYRFRATKPDSTEIIMMAESSIYFEPAKFSVAVSASEETQVGKSVEFTSLTQNETPGTTYEWHFEDGSVIDGKSASKSFDVPDRQLVKLRASVPGLPEKIDTLHHVNIARPYAETIYPLATTSFAPQTTVQREYSWIPCGPSWDVYYGKYNQLWIDSNEASMVDRQHILNYLALADFVFESYSDIFGWDYLPEASALVTHTCSGIPGGGTGTGGTFFNISPYVQAPEIELKSTKYGATIHEFIHAWDFRGGSWINSDDPAHSFTGGMEPIVNHIQGTGETISAWGGDLQLLDPLPSHFVLSHYMRVNLRRYLSKAELKWDNYYSADFLSFGYDNEPIPANKEKMLVQGGLLMSLYQMHGKDALTSIFMEVESTLESREDLAIDGVGFANLSQADRAEVFMRAVADGLQLNVSDYFRYWKWPIEPIAGYMARYPASTKTQDLDRDGYSPLTGDANDNDASIYPYAPELVDGKDNNQDGLFDENLYDEAGNDIEVRNITLPAALHGTISDLSDVDTYRFTLSETTVLTFTAYGKDAAGSVPYSNENSRTISTFAGNVRINGSIISDLVHEAMSAPQSVTAITLPAGSHTVSVDVNMNDGRNPNPGDYEIQLFVNDYSPGFTAASFIDRLYPQQKQ